MRSLLRIFLLSALILGFSWFLASLSLTSKVEERPISGTLRVGWMEYYPYQFTQREHGMTRRDGLGFSLVQACFRKAGYSPEFQELSWQEQLEAVQAGNLDVLMLATPSLKRMESAHFSTAYATFKLGSFYSLPDLSEPPEDPAALKAYCAIHQVKVSITRGFVHPNELDPLITEARQQGRLTEVSQAQDNLKLLAQRRVQLTFVDELVGFSLLRERRWQQQIGYQTLDCDPAPVCLMFSKKSVSPEVVARFSQGFEDLRNDGSQSALVRTYLYPRLLGILTQSQFFRIITISAAMFAGFTGVLIAHREGYDWVGALVLASCPAVAGGIMRDLVVSRNPLGVVADPVNLVGVACLMVGIGLFFRLAPQRWRRAVEAMDPSTDQRLLFFDTLGLGAYTVNNVFVAMACACEPLWLWGPLLAVFQNGGGGVVRDLLLGRGGSIAILKGVIYGEIAFVGALCLSLFFIHYSQRSDYSEEQMVAASLITMAAVIVVRTLVLARGWKAPNL